VRMSVSTCLNQPIAGIEFDEDMHKEIHLERISSLLWIPVPYVRNANLRLQCVVRLARFKFKRVCVLWSLSSLC